MRRCLRWLARKLDVLFMAPPFSSEADQTLSAWKWLGVVVLALVLACDAPAPPTDKPVASKFVGTKQGSATGFAGGHVLILPVTEAAYYLVSRDNMVCEVDARTYAAVAVGRLASCVWGEPS